MAVYTITQVSAVLQVYSVRYTGIHQRRLKRKWGSEDA